MNNEKRRVRGPGSGRAKGVGNKQQAIKYHKCDIRLDDRQNSVLDKIAERYGVSRSDVMRRSLDNYANFVVGEEE